MITIGIIAFVAAVVNGALGYGFSSIAVPLALLVVSNRELNPAVVLVEIVMNTYVLWNDRAALPQVWRRAAWVAAALPVGIIAGTEVLVHADPTWLKLGTFIGLLPLILLQAAGVRRVIRAERAAGLALGGGVGALYAITTISGPPLALFLNNQGYAKREFRAALGTIKIVAATLTFVVYARNDVITEGSLRLLWVMLPALIAGVPVGAWLIHRVPEETFRRVCMCFDAAIVAFGISALLRTLGLISGPLAFTPLALVLAYDATILTRYLRRAPSGVVSAAASPAVPLEPTAP